MINLNPTIANLLTQRFGSQPVYSVDIQWAVNGPWLSYTAEERAGSSGLLVSLGNIDSAVRFDKSGNSTSVSVTLDDSKGAIKSIIDQNDPQTRPVRVYLSFAGETSRQLIYSGSISSPIVWRESDRSFSFDAIEEIKTRNFSVVSDDFISSALTSQAASRPWPVGFGTVRRGRALDLESGPYGQMDEEVTIPDPWLPLKFNGYGRTAGIRSGDIYAPPVLPSPSQNTGTTGSTGTTISSNYDGVNFAPPTPNPRFKQWNTNRVTQRERLRALIQSQQAAKKSRFKLAGFERFPLNTALTIGTPDRGYIRGQVRSDGYFYPTEYGHPEQNDVNNYRIRALMYNQLPTSSYAAIPKVWTAGVLDYEIGMEDRYSRPGAIGAVLLEEDIDAIPESTQVVYPRGTRVSKTLGPGDFIYTVNIIPSTVHKVEARVKSAGDEAILSDVPTSWYTVRQTTVGSLSVTELVFNRPPSTFGEEWLDEIYVTYTSSVGPAPSDCIKWVVENFTSYSVDAASFASVKSRIGDQYHCVVPEGSTAIDVIRDMAYQCRCAVYLYQGVIYLKYLGAEATSVSTFTLSDIIAGSLDISHTSTDELVTDLTATWTEDYFKDPLQLRVRNNITKYGVSAEETDFWCFSQRQPVERSAAFWVNRNSRSWRLVSFRTVLDKLNLTVFDTVTLNLPTLGLNLSGCIIESVYVDVEANEIQFQVWTPSLAGTTSKYIGAYPDNVGYVIPFDAGVQYTAPPNHPVFRLQGTSATRLLPSWERLYLPYNPPFAYPSASNLNATLNPSLGWVAGPG